MEKIDLKKGANPREQILGALVLLAVFVMFLKVIHLPKQEATAQLKTQINTLKLEKEALQKFTAALLATLPQKKEGQREQPGNFDIQILKGKGEPVAKTISPLLEYITTPQFLNGVAIKSMSYLEPKNENGFVRTSFAVEAHGSFRMITRYLERLANLPALVRIDNVSVKTTDPKAAKVDIEINASLFQLEAQNAKGV